MTTSEAVNRRPVGGTHIGPFVMMGGLTVLVATPCTAPVMGAALGFALVQPTAVGLVVFTALIGLLLALDLYPPVADWLAGWGVEPPRLGREWYGYRFALIAAVLGGARVLYGALDSLLDGRLGADLALRSGEETVAEQITRATDAPSATTNPEDVP